MPEFLPSITENISQQLDIYLPRIAGAMIVLLGGWLAAHTIARIVQAITGRTKLETDWGSYFSVGQDRSLAAILGSLAFYTVMLLVLAAFFNTLALPVVSDPLNHFLARCFDFAPRVIGAIAIALVGWALARIVREASRRALETINADERLATLGNSSLRTRAAEHPLASGRTKIGADSQPAPTGEMELVSVTKSVPDAAYWLILLLFLPAVLGTLQLHGILEPVQAMFTKTLNYLPNIVGATVVFFVGWYVAHMIRTVVSNLTASLGINRLADRVGLANAMHVRKLSDIVGLLCYTLVLLPVLVASLNVLNIDAITQPAGQILAQITSLIPGMLGAVLVVSIAYFLGKIASGVVEDLLVGVGFDNLPKQLGMLNASHSLPATPTPRSASPSRWFGRTVLVLVMLLAMRQALPLMGLHELAAQMQILVSFVIQVLVGAAIMLLGLYLATGAAGIVRKSGVDQAERLATVAKVTITIFIGAIGLQHMGLAPTIVNLAFGTLLGGLGLAIAIAFGWGGRDAAKRLIDRYVN